MHCRAQRSLHEPARQLLQSTAAQAGVENEAPASLGSLLTGGPPAAPVNASSQAQIEEAGASSGSSTAQPTLPAILQGVPAEGAPEQAPASAPQQAVLAPAEAPPQLVLLPVDNLQTPAVRAAAAAAAAAEEAAAALGPASVAETEELASNPVERSLPQVSHVHVLVQGSWAQDCACCPCSLTSWAASQCSAAGAGLPCCRGQLPELGHISSCSLHSPHTVCLVSARKRCQRPLQLPSQEQSLTCSTLCLQVFMSCPSSSPALHLFHPHNSCGPNKRAQPASCVVQVLNSSPPPPPVQPPPPPPPPPPAAPPAPVPAPAPAPYPASAPQASMTQSLEGSGEAWLLPQPDVQLRSADGCLGFMALSLQQESDHRRVLCHQTLALAHCTCSRASRGQSPCAPSAQRRANQSTPVSADPCSAHASCCQPCHPEQASMQLRLMHAAQRPPGFSVHRQPGERSEKTQLQ